MIRTHLNNIRVCAGVPWDAAPGVSGAVWLFQTSREQHRDAPKVPRPFGLLQKNMSAALQTLRMEQPFAADCALHPTVFCSNASREYC